jgi:hypothetical protein
VPRVIRGGNVYFVVADDDLIKRTRELKKLRKKEKKINRRKKHIKN